MPYIEAEALQQARRVDLLSWLQANEPWNLVHISGNNYCTKEHDSLKISNGKWYWFSRGFGGASALDYLIKVKEYTLPQAVEMIVGGAAVKEPVYYYAPNPKPKELVMPDLERNPRKAVKYLESRGIQPEVIEYCLNNSLIYESIPYHNVVFVGYDKNGIARYGAMRGTMSSFKGEVTGSDKHYSFSITDPVESGHLHLFESAIDLLSYASMELLDGRNWRQDSMLSLAGVSGAKNGRVVPAALKQYLEDHPKIHTLHLHLDNDEVGRAAAIRIWEGLEGKYTVFNEPADEGCKDMNDQLKKQLGIDSKRKEVLER
ncbi:MAG: toprim domain-containing protein [Parasporobacterium sp.]|jgi:hypothetical protein|nr:toprim domain-containing protein [Parasporobacterium sp.]